MLTIHWLEVAAQFKVWSAEEGKKVVAQRKDNLISKQYCKGKPLTAYAGGTGGQNLYG